MLIYLCIQLVTLCWFCGGRSHTSIWRTYWWLQFGIWTRLYKDVTSLLICEIINMYRKCIAIFCPMEALTEIMNTILQTYNSNSRLPHNMDGILILMVLTWIYLWKSILWTNSFLQSFISIILCCLSCTNILCCDPEVLYQVATWNLASKFWDFASCIVALFY